MTAEIPYSIHPLSKPPRATRRLQGPRAAAFSCPPEPCPTFATLASPLSILPHLSFPALPRQPNLPHSTETLARSPKEELLFGGRPYFSIYTGPDWSSTGWQSLGMYLRFCCARRDSPPERNRTHTRFFFSGVDIFGLPDLRRGLGNGTLRASASQILGAVLLLRAEGRRERVPGPESWLSHFEIDVPRASPIIKVLGGHLFLSTQWSRVHSSRTLLPPRAVGVPMRPSSFVTQKPRHKSRRGLHHLSLGSIANVKVVCKMRIPSQFYASSILCHSFSRYGIPAPRYTAKQRSTDLSINGTASSSHSIQPLKLPRADICTCFVSSPLFPSGTSSCLQSLMQVQSSHGLHA